MAAMGEAETPRRDADRVIDLDRPATREAPVPGAQWDELHERWEFWDEATHSWHSVDAEGRHATRPEATGLPQIEPLHASVSPVPADAEEDERPHLLDLDRLAEPAVHVPGAQWNEVTGRWERWDDSAEAWVEVNA